MSRLESRRGRLRWSPGVLCLDLLIPMRPRIGSTLVRATRRRCVLVPGGRRAADRDPATAQRDRVDPAARACRARDCNSDRNRLGEGWALQISRATWPLLFAWPIAVAFVFPNGRLLSPGAGAGSSRGRRQLRRDDGGALLDPAPFYGGTARVGAEPDRRQRRRANRSTYAARVPGCSNSASWRVCSPGALAIHLRVRRSTGSRGFRCCGWPGPPSLIPLALLMCLDPGSGLVAGDVVRSTGSSSRCCC